MSPDASPSRDPRPGAHLSPGQLALYARQQLPPAELLAVDDHLASCAACQDALAEVWDAAPAWAAWRDLAAPAAPPRADFGRWAWPLAAGLLLLAGAALFVRESAVSRQRERQVAGLEARLRAAEPELERLRAANRELERRVERLAAVPSVPPVHPPGVRARLADHGRPLELLADGSLTGLPGLAPVWRTAMAQALLTGTLAVSPSLRDVRTAGSPLRGDRAPDTAEPPFSVVGPVGTLVRDDRPRFRWTPLAGATGYRLVLFDRGYRKVLESGEVPGTEWTPPQPLPQGQVLVWQVLARRGGEEIAVPAPPAPEARLRVLTRAERAALETAEGEVAGSHLARAVLLARTGLLEEARAELSALARENPGSPAVGRLNASLASDRR